MQNQPQPQPFSGSVVEPASAGSASFAPPAPGSNVRLTSSTVASRPDPAAPAPKKSHRHLREASLRGLVSQIAGTFSGRCGWK